ncbi:hypothetical protein PAHAL_3G488000 [Panicum hallii]|uniref:Uncharacterized protein n=1 Tax=Panicum hallii TaxID=206008 RepID=A0A2T8KLX4_9POAL|nr:hypothetical protein PAHAL_3G488000 [Panicum hallii]
MVLKKPSCFGSLWHTQQVVNERYALVAHEDYRSTMLGHESAVLMTSTVFREVFY